MVGNVWLGGIIHRKEIEFVDCNKNQTFFIDVVVSLLGIWDAAFYRVFGYRKTASSKVEFRFTEKEEYLFEIVCNVDVLEILLFIVLILDSICWLIFLRLEFVDLSLSSKSILVFADSPGSVPGIARREHKTGSWSERVN